MKHCIFKPWAQAVLEARLLPWAVAGQNLGATTAIVCKSSMVLLLEKSTSVYTADKAAPCSHADPPNTTGYPSQSAARSQATCQWRHGAQIFTTLNKHHQL